MLAPGPAPTTGTFALTGTLRESWLHAIDMRWFHSSSELWCTRFGTIFVGARAPNLPQYKRTTQAHEKVREDTYSIMIAARKSGLDKLLPLQ
jgi:hypothetical protein